MFLHKTHRLSPFLLNSIRFMARSHRALALALGLALALLFQWDICTVDESIHRALASALAAVLPLQSEWVLHSFER